MITCWCGNSDLSSFGSDYMRCSACETLVSRLKAPMKQQIVNNDAADFYGKQYWLRHQQQDLGQPDIYARSRNDLKERNLHWLKTLLKYSLPPSEVLEVGCSHGSFVALMTQAGYQAEGMEMSPWVVDFGRKTFKVPIHVGPIENLDFPSQSLDVIVLMDVLEHLPDPLTTMSKCTELLKPDGFLLIQTPEFKGSTRYEHLVDKSSSFLAMLKADEHLYLFSRRSVTKLLEQIGAERIYFEPAIFSHYDMFLVAGRNPIKSYSFQESENTLLQTPSGRMVIALLELRAQELALDKKLQHLNQEYQQADTDRIGRLEQIQTLTGWLEESQATIEELRKPDSE